MSQQETSDGRLELTPEERYRLDLDGYLVIDDVLSEGEVEELNRLIDEQNLPEPSKESRKARFNGFLTWGQPFRDLLDHERIMPVLAEMLGDGFRLDHYYGIYLEKGTTSLPLHGGGTPHDPSEFYHNHRGEMYNGLIVVSWNLRDTGPEHGGFCCIPGSHKASYECPEGIHDPHAEAETLDDIPDAIAVPEAKAGSVVIFTEALTHGTTPWVADHQRRSLLYKYAPSYLAWGEHGFEEAEAAELTPRQRLLLEQPYISGRDSVLDDG